MTDTNVSEPSADLTVEGTSVPNTNDWQKIASAYQSNSDKYVNLTDRFGTDPNTQLEQMQVFKDQLQDDFEGTIDTLREQAGIKKQPTQPTVSQEGNEGINPFEFDKPGSYSANWLESQVEKRTKDIVEKSLQQERDMAKMAEMQGILAEKGITNELKQRQIIKEFYNPPQNFGGFVDGKLAKTQPAPPGALDQVKYNQATPQTAGILEGVSEPLITDEAAEVNEVMELANRKSNAQKF